MEKRVLLAIVLCVGILVAWGQFFAPSSPAPAPAPGAEKPAGAPAESAGKAAVPTAPPAPGAPAGAASSAPTTAQVPAAPERQTRFTTADQLFVMSNRGAALRHARLRETKYLQSKGDPASGVDLVRSDDPRYAPLRISFPDSKFATPADHDWHVVAEGPDHVVYRSETPMVRIEKHFRVDPTRYRLHLDVTVENRSPAPHDHHLAIHVYGKQEPGAKGGFFSGPTGNPASIVCHTDDKTVRTDIDALGKEPLDKVGAVRWVAADEKFFLVAAVPYPENPARERRCMGRPTTETDGGEGTLSFAERALGPGQRTQYSFAVFIGPKVMSDLDQVRPGGQDVGLTEAVDVSLAFLSRPLLWLLKLFHSFSGNWGLAIILLTVFIRILTFYPTQKALLSAKKMQRLGPKLAAIRKKYESDRQRQSVETMNLYKAHGVSPFGGCLPSLIQMPIWIALYSTLNYAVELFRSPFVLHIRDLTAKDPYYITPLLMGGVMFVQMKMSPTSPDNQQQAMMAVLMPVMFTAFSLVLPSGLALYMLTSYLIGILQQLYVNHLDRKAGGAAA